MNVSKPSPSGRERPLFPAACFTLLLLTHCAGPPPQVVIREIASGLDHNHVTTRQFQHMVFQHEGIWFAFYSDGKDFRFQTSSDSGATWAAGESPVAPAPNGSTSFDILKTGDTVYIGYTHYPLGRYDVNAPYAKDLARRGEYTSEGRIKTGQIEGDTIRWTAERDPGFTLDYTNLVRDSGGYLWAFTRTNQVGTAYRSRQPDSIDDWRPASECIPIKGRHAMDAAALDDGKLYAASVLTTEGKLYGNLYDGGEWGAEPTLIADDMTTVAGDDRRLAIDFDPTERRLHLIYVDSSSILRYRSLVAPYRPEDWRPPLSSKGLDLGQDIFTAALSVDTSSVPYGLVITYGLQRHAGSDARVLTGELHARRFDGRGWQGEPVLVSQPGAIHNWYPNVNRDARDGLAVLYSRSTDPNHLGTPLSAMVSIAPSF